MSRAFGRLEYTLNDVEVVGDKATADVTVNNADIDAALQNAMSDLQNSDDSEVQALINNRDEKGLMQKFFEAFYDEVDKVDMIGDKGVTFELEKNDDGNWKITDDSIAAFYETISPRANAD